MSIDAASFTADRRRLRTIAFAAEWLAVAGIAMVAGYVGYLILMPGALALSLQRDVTGIVTWPNGFAFAAAILLSLVPAAIFVVAMLAVRSLFRLFGRSATIFHPDVPPLLRWLGLLAVTAAIAGVVTRTAIALLMTSANPPGQQQLILAISSADITSLILGLLLFAFALVMQEGIRLDEDNRSIV